MPHPAEHRPNVREHPLDAPAAAHDRSPDSYVAGATVLHPAEDTPRYSADLDLFHDLEDSVARSAEADAATMQAAGCELAWLLRTPNFHRAVVRVDRQALKIEWAHSGSTRDAGAARRNWWQRRVRLAPVLRVAAPTSGSKPVPTRLR